MPGHIYCRQRNSGEAEVIGGDDLFERFPPAEQPLTGGGVAPGSSPPASECSPEEDAWWSGELRRSRVGRR